LAEAWINAQRKVHHCSYLVVSLGFTILQSAKHPSCQQCPPPPPQDCWGRRSAGAMSRRKELQAASCNHCINPDIRSVIFDCRQPTNVLDVCDVVLRRREQAIWLGAVEIVVAAASFLGYDVRRSPMIPCVSSVLVLLAVFGLRGALKLNQKQIVCHALLAASVSGAICVNFVIETLAGVVDTKKDMPPAWLVLLVLVLPYFALLCLSAAGGLLGVALHELGTQLEEDDSSGFSSEELEANAAALQGYDLCCVCSERRKDAALVPCGHKAMCLNCAMNVQRRGLACPVCREPITQVLRVYDS